MTDQVDPTAEYAEIMLKHKGTIKRLALRRQSYAECLDPECPMAWEGTSAVGASIQHVRGSGHTVRASYQADFEYSPNHEGLTITQVAPDIEKVSSELRALTTKPKKSLPQKPRSKVTRKKDVG